MTTTATPIPCRVEADITGNTPIWDCPCRECWTLEQNLNTTMGIDDEAVTYDEWKAERL